MDSADPIFVHGTDDNPEMKFGPWLLVSRRRGRARGRGGGTGRAAHVTLRSAAGPDTEDTESRGTALHCLRGGSRFVGSGRPSTMHTSHTASRSDAVANPLDQSPVTNLAVDFNMGNPSNCIQNNPSDPSHYSSDTPIPEAPVLPDSSFQNTSLYSSRDNPPPISSNQNTSFRNTREAIKTNSLPRSTSPPPILCTSVPEVSPHIPSTGHLHNSLVAQVSPALESSKMEEDSEDDEGSTDGDDDEMSDEVDDGLDDSMTLVQYQAEIRRDALIRKGSNTNEISPKKGRMEPQGSVPS